MLIYQYTSSQQFKTNQQNKDKVKTFRVAQLREKRLGNLTYKARQELKRNSGTSTNLETHKIYQV